MKKEKVAVETNFEREMLEARARAAMLDIMSGYAQVVEYLVSLENEAPPLQGTELEAGFSEIAKGLYPEVATNGFLRAYIFWHHIIKAWEIFSGEEGTPPPTPEELRTYLRQRRAERRASRQK